MGTSRFDRGATTHGQRRIRERMKLPARAIRRLVEAARNEGLTFDRMPGWLKIAVRHKQELHPELAEYRFYRGYLFVFQPGPGDLITTYPINEEEPEDEPVDWGIVRKARRFVHRIH